LWPLVLALSLKERSGDTVVSCILWVILKTSVTSLHKRNAGSRNAQTPTDTLTYVHMHGPVLLTDDGVLKTIVILAAVHADLQVKLRKVTSVPRGGSVFYL